MWRRRRRPATSGSRRGWGSSRGRCARWGTEKWGGTGGWGGGLGWGVGKMGYRDVVVHGVLEVALPESLDFWGREMLVATLARVGEQEVSAAERANAGLIASFSHPRARLRDPEAYREALTKQWMDRVRAFTKQVESEQAPLRLPGCGAPRGGGGLGGGGGGGGGGGRGAPPSREGGGCGFGGGGWPAWAWRIPEASGRF